MTLFLIMDRNYGGNIEYSSLTTNYQRGQYDEEQQHFETQKMSFVQMGKLVDHENKMWETFLVMIGYVMRYKKCLF